MYVSLLCLHRSNVYVPFDVEVVTCLAYFPGAMAPGQISFVVESLA